MTPALHLERATARFGRDLVLHPVSLGLGPRERVVIRGPNGGGKTTLVRLLLGLTRPSSGRRRCDRWPLRPALVPQAPSFDRTFPLTVEAVIRLGVRGAKARPNAAEALRRFELAPLSRAYLAELSGGELQRVLLARAWANDPDLLALDEPTNSLDGAGRERFWQHLATLDPRVTVLLVTHEPPAPEFAATRSWWVDRGLRELPGGPGE